MSRIKSQISYYDLTGGLNNVNTQDTINSSPKKTESPDMINVEFFKLGGIKSMEGNVQFGDTQSSSIVGGWEYTKNNNKYMIIALKTGELKIYNPVTEEFDEIYKFQSQANRVSFCNMNNGIVATNGIDDPVFYEKGRHQLLAGAISTTANSTAITGNGTQFTVELKPGDRIQIDDSNTDYIIDVITDDTNLTLTSEFPETLSDVNYYLSEISPCNAQLINTDPEVVPTPAPIPIRGTAIQFFAGRLWIGGEKGLFYSQIGQYNKWDEYYDAGVIPEVYNDTSEVRALGLYSNYMLVHKEFNTYLLIMTSDSSSMSIQPYSNVSCDSQQSWIVSNTKYYVYSAENMDIYPLSQRTIYSDRYLGEAITNKVRNVFQNLRDADLKNIFCVSLPRKRWMIFYMPMVEQVGSGYALIYDFQVKAFVPRRIPQDVTIAFNYMNEVYVGTSDGLVLKEFTGRDFNGETLVSYFKSPWYDWAGDYYHSFAEFAIDMASEYNNNFYIRTFKDGDSPYEDRIIDDGAIQTTGLIWDGDTHIETNNTKWDDDTWVSGNFNSIRMLLPNNVFETFQVEIGTNTLGQAFAIYGYNFRRLETEEAPW